MNKSECWLDNPSLHPNECGAEPGHCPKHPRTCCDPKEACAFFMQELTEASETEQKRCEHIMSQPITACTCNNHCEHLEKGFSPYTCLGFPCSADPNIAVEGVLGERNWVDGEWWYECHPCLAYIRGTNYSGLRCDSVTEQSGLCAPCRMALKKELND